VEADVERTLERTEAKFAKVFNVCPDFITITDCATGRYLDVNDAFERITGFTRSEAVGHTAFDIGIWETPAERQRMLRALVASPRLEGFDVRIRRKSGEIIDAQLSVERTVLDGEDCLIIVGRDNSDRKRVESALRRSEGFLREAQTAANIGYYVYDIRADHWQSSDILDRIFGIGPDYRRDAEGWLALVTDDRRAGMADYLRSLLASGDRFDHEYTIRRPEDGECRWVAGLGNLERDSAGRPLRLIGTIQDITARKKVEQALTDSERRFRIVSSMTSDVVYSCHRTETGGFRIDWLGGHVERVFGHTADEIKSQGCWRTFVVADDVPIFTENISELRTGRSSNCVIRITHADGAVRHLHSVARIFDDPNDFGHHRLYGALQDITDSKRAEEALVQINRKVMASNAELEQFAYVASHDLREPLRMVSSYITLLERRFNQAFDSEAREFLYFARDGAQRMDRMVLDLLEFSRVGRKTEPFAPVKLSQLVATAVDDLAPTITETAATITVADDLPEVTASRGELVRLFLNLIGNALKYRHPERPPTIAITARRDGREWVVSVADNGIGIAPEYFERIFGIFQRLHTREKYEGTGIGLAICKKIVEHHGGRIWVESQPERGATFHFALPDTSATA